MSGVKCCVNGSLEARKLHYRGGQAFDQVSHSQASDTIICLWSL